MNEALPLERFNYPDDNSHVGRVKATVYCMMPPWNDALFVRVSTNFKLRETLVFKCDDAGEVLDWTELEGIRDVIPHDEMIMSIGYQIRNP